MSKLPAVISFRFLPSRETDQTCRQPSPSLTQVNDFPPLSQTMSSTTSTQVLSCSVRMVWTVPVAASAMSRSRVFCSRLSRCTTTWLEFAAQSRRAR